MPQRYNTPVKWGCPYDCGLCTDHEQHSCLTLVEICDFCNLRCPICYAASGPDRQQFRTLDQIERMLDAVVRNEGEPDVVQISGGEPTMHPDFFAVLELAKARPIRHLMVNTNGVKIAESEAFAERLATYMPDFEVYLQFDSFERDALIALRGADLRAVREKALERLNRHGISTTLVVTLKKGLNDHEIGRIIDFALEQPCVRGVTFQPMQDAGRADGFDPSTRSPDADRSAAEASSSRRRCSARGRHPGAVSSRRAGDGLRAEARREGDAADRADRSGRADQRRPEHDRLRAGRRRCATGSSSCSPPTTRRRRARARCAICCAACRACSLPEHLGYENIFRVIIMQFIDAHAFDVRSVKKSCVHIVHPEDGRLIPFDTYNLFYRDHLEETVLGPLRARVAAR